MTLTEEPQQLRKLQQFYVAQVEQFYQQVQEWGKGKMKFTLSEYPLGDKTGEYQTHLLIATLIQKQPDELGSTVYFFPQGITFLTEEGTIELEGSFRKEELVYKQKDKLEDTEEDDQTMSLDDGFEEGWYWKFRGDSPGKIQWRRFTEAVFWEQVRECTSYSTEELS